VPGSSFAVNWDVLRLHVEGHNYDLRPGSSPAIEVTFNRVAP